MTISELKNNIEHGINFILDNPTDLLFKENQNNEYWNNLNPKEISSFISSIKLLLKKVKQNMSKLDNIGYNYLDKMFSAMQTYEQNYNQIGSTHSVGMDGFASKCLHELQRLNSFIRESALFFELTYDPSLKHTLEELSTKSPLMMEILASEEKISKAIETAGLWLEQQNDVNKGIINEHARIYDTKSDDYSGIKRWGWAVMAIIFGLISFLLVFDFYDKTEISTAEALLKIFRVIIPSYFSVFSIQQFVYNKKMSDVYSFKSACLKTMTNLFTTHPDKTDEILKKGLDTLFIEPTVKHESGYDKQVVLELINLLKGQIKN